MKRSTLVAAIVITAATVSPRTSEADESHDTNRVPAAAVSAEMSEGEVRKVDKETGRITIKHGPLANLDMPAMTMVFRAKDPTLLDRVKPGDKIKFVAEKVGGAYIVTEIERAR